MLSTLALAGFEHLHVALVAMLCFGIVGIFLMVLGFKIFDWLMPRVDFQKELAEKQNVAVAIVIAAVILGVAAIAVVSML